jgi:hypothetical protein
VADGAGVRGPAGASGRGPDFGIGGADTSRGTGLAGVEKRLATFDGIMALSSPAGGPTMVVMEVPCASSSLKISSC